MVSIQLIRQGLSSFLINNSKLKSLLYNIFVTFSAVNTICNTLVRRKTSYCSTVRVGITNSNLFSSPLCHDNLKEIQKCKKRFDGTRGRNVHSSFVPRHVETIRHVGMNPVSEGTDFDDWNLFSCHVRSARKPIDREMQKTWNHQQSYRLIGQTLARRSIIPKKRCWR